MYLRVFRFASGASFFFVFACRFFPCTVPRVPAVSAKPTRAGVQLSATPLGFFVPRLTRCIHTDAAVFPIRFVCMYALFLCLVYVPG